MSATSARFGPVQNSLSGSRSCNVAAAARTRDFSDMVGESIVGYAYAGTLVRESPSPPTTVRGPR